MRFVFNICKTKKIIIFTAIILAFFVLVSGVLAGDGGLGATANVAFEGSVPFSGNTDTPASIIGTIVGAGLAFIGVIFFVLIIYGGFLWMTARGNEQQVAKAKDLITSAAIGLIIVLAAYAITAYIGGVLK